MFNSQFMELALEQARKAYGMGEVPVGAIIVDKNSQVISSAHNEVESSNNPCNHAEMIAIYRACKKISSKCLAGCSIYVTLEPCGMCGAAISYTKLSRLYYASPDPKFGAIENGVRLFSSPSALFRPEIYNLIKNEESSALLTSFFRKLR